MRFMMLALVMAFSTVLAAQDGGIRATGIRLAAEAVAATVPATIESPQPGQQAPTLSAPQGRARRRPSMVGYIGDSSIGSQVRVRLDAGFELTEPDRAEVFYGKCGCFRGLPVDHPAYDPDAPGPAPGIAEELNFQQLYVLGEYAMSSRASVYGEIPLRWVQPQSFVSGTGSFPNTSGLSDVKGGVKVALTTTEERTVTVQLQADAPSGDAAKALGTDHWSVSPALLYFQRIGERTAIESQFGSIHPIGGSAGIPTSGPDKFAGSVLMYGVGASVDVASSGSLRVAPVLELVGWRVMSGFQSVATGSIDGINIVNAKFGVRLSSGDHGSVYFGYGRALTDASWYHDIVRAEYRVGF